MSLSEVLTRRSQPAIPSSVPNTNYVESAINRIFDRWPDINPEAREEDHEKILGQLYDIITTDSWQDVKTSFVISGFNIAFIDRYKNRNDVRAITDFAFNELKATTKPSIVNALMRIYSSTFSLNSDNTEKLGEILNTKTELLGQKWRRILSKFPDYLVSEQAPETIADSMISMENPWVSLKQVGMNDPFASGIMDYAHEAYVTRLAPDLDNQETIERLFEWLIPETGKNKTTGNVIVVEALIDHWLNQTPPEPIRQYITENLISLYDDPRIRPERWNTVDQKYKDVLFGWLTKEDLRFFTSVVDSTQTDPMWVPRRNFWLKLYNDDMIDQAWVAFSPRAERYARQNFSSGRSDLGETRFARQTGRQGTETSLLFLRIGNKIFVDGCHNFKTHVWTMSDPAAPRLFKSWYSCDSDIMRKSMVSKSHNHIPSWQSWVMEKIYATVPNSTYTPVNWDDPSRSFSSRSMEQRNPATDGQFEPARVRRSFGNRSNQNVEAAYSPTPRAHGSQLAQVSQSEPIHHSRPTLESFDIDNNSMVAEVNKLASVFSENDYRSFNLRSSIRRVQKGQTLNTSNKKEFENLFTESVISAEDYPNLSRFLKPIFKETSGHGALTLWQPIIDELVNAANQNSISISPKAKTALGKIKEGEQNLTRTDINAFENFLQNLRTNKVSIDQFL